MSICLVVTGVLIYSLLVILSYVKPKTCVLCIGIRFLKHTCSDRLKTTLVSPLGQGWSAYKFCNCQLNAALFSPSERGLASPVLNLYFASRLWKPGWAPPVRLNAVVIWFYFE